MASNRKEEIFLTDFLKILMMYEALTNFGLKMLTQKRTTLLLAIN